MAVGGNATWAWAARSADSALVKARGPLIAGQAVVYDDVLYFLSDPTSEAQVPLSRLVRVRL